MTNSRYLAVWLAFGMLVTAQAANWPRLGGPNGAGVSSETGLARTWPNSGPRVLWTNDVAEGFAGPAVYDNQVYLLDRLEDNQDNLRCFDLASGNELWHEAYAAPGRLPFNGSRNVPTVDEHHVFTVGPFGQLHCYDRLTHRSIWSHHLVDDFKDPQIDKDPPPQSRPEKLLRAQVPQWGFTQAPLLYKDLVILAPQTQTTGLVAYEQSTGNLRWRTGYIGRNWYSHVSPTLVSLGGADQVIMLAQPSDPEKAPDQAPPALISSFDPNNGTLLWTNATPGPYKCPIPQPLRVDDSHLLINGGFGLGNVMYQVTRTDGKWEAKLQFQNQTATAFIHSPILYQDRIYLMSIKEHGGKNTGLVCENSLGEALWQSGPALQFDTGALLIADNLAFVMHGKSGELNLFDIKDPTAQFVVKAKILEAKNNQVWAPMALSNGKLFVRDQHQLKCLDVQNP